MDYNNLNYHQKKNIDYTLRLRNILATLPSFAKDFFRSIEPNTSAKTRISYAYDIRVFFEFLVNNNSYFKDKTIDNISLSDIESLKSVDIEEYVEYLKVYKNNNDKINTNTERGLSRKLSALRSFYKYYQKHDLIKNNPTSIIDMPKIHEKAIIRLETDEAALLLDYIEKDCEQAMSNKQKAYYEKTKYRDLAIVTLLLGTGIRVSECVGIDINDVDFKNNGITITRKGGNQSIIYFGDEVEKAIKDYLINDRNNITACAGSENALFLSTRKTRIGIQAVENMVKKYAKQVTPNKKITPHKLRSTYGTSLYKETGDIYLVADVLGHKDVNTTKKHYAAIDENRRKSAANIVKLR